MAHLTATIMSGPNELFHVEEQIVGKVPEDTVDLICAKIKDRARTTSMSTSPLTLLLEVK